MSDQQSDADPSVNESVDKPADGKPVELSVSEKSANPLAETKTGEHPPATVETEWIPGEQLELIRIPPPTIWPATLALGTTGIAFGVVTHWILSVAGLFLFLLGAAGWIEDMRKDVLQ